MDDCAELEEILAIARKTLARLERKKAGHTSLSIPTDLEIEIEDKREEVKNLEKRLREAQQAKEERQQAEREETNRPSLMRSRVPDEYYIERDEAKRVRERFARALEQPQGQPLLFNICGIGGVGKTTLIGRLQEAHASNVDFVGVCFAKTAGIETPLKLMRKLHQQALELAGVETNADSFARQERQFEDALFQLSHQSVDGEATSGEEERKILNWFERFIWLSPTGLISTPSRSKSFEMSGSGFSALTAIAEDPEGIQEWIQQRVRHHPATKDRPELQALMLEPVPKLTQAFAESLVQIAQRTGRSLVVVLDTYEKAQAYLNQWLWQYLVEDTPLSAAPVRLLVVGRRSLQTDESWRKLNQDRKLLYEVQLKKFSKQATQDYLEQIGIKNGGTRAKIYKVTQGLPYYLDWVRKQREQGEEPDFSRGNQAIAELLLQGIDSRQRKILQIVACCRWFDLAMLRYLLENESLDLQQNGESAESCFEWLTRSDFVELSDWKYRLDDVARDVFRQSYYQEDRTQFRKTNARLADYFKQQADELYDSQSLLPDPYQDEEWREPIAEFLYYGLFSPGREGLQRYIEQFFTAVYLGAPDVFMIPLTSIRAEIGEENKSLLPTETGKFFSDAGMALGFGWQFLNKPPNSYTINFEGENIPSEEEIEAFSKQIEASIQTLLGYVGDLGDGLGKSIGLISKAIRCTRSGERHNLLSQAKSQTEQIQTRRPKLIHHLFSNLGHLLYGEEYYEESLSCYQKALEFEQGNAIAFFNQGAAFANLERYEEALTSYQKAIDLDSKYFVAWVNQGAAFANLERYEEALASYQKAIDLDSGDVVAWANQGAAFADLERYEEALASYQEAIDLDSKYFVAWLNLGSTLNELKQYEEAITACDRAYEINSQNDKVLNSQALTLSLLKDFEKAMKAIDEAIDLNPKDVLLKANRGIILARAGRYTEALADCEQAIKQNPKHESGYYGKACCHALQGEVEPAIENLQKAINIAPRRSRREAKHNPDFDRIRDNERFRALVYPESQR